MRHISISIRPILAGTSPNPVGWDVYLRFDDGPAIIPPSVHWLNGLATDVRELMGEQFTHLSFERWWDLAATFRCLKYTHSFPLGFRTALDRVVPWVPVDSVDAGINIREGEGVVCYYKWYYHQGNELPNSSYVEVTDERLGPTISGWDTVLNTLG